MHGQGSGDADQFGESLELRGALHGELVLPRGRHGIEEQRLGRGHRAVGWPAIEFAISATTVTRSGAGTTAESKQATGGGELMPTGPRCVTSASELARGLKL